MRRRTILVVSTSYPLVGDGSEAAGAFVADFVSALGTEVPVRVVGPGIEEGHEPDAAVPTWRFSAGRRPLSLLSPLKPWHWPAILRALRSMRRQVFAAAADGQVAHIHALWVLPSGWAARAVARRTGATYSVWALGSDIWTLGRLPLVRGLLTSIVRDAHTAYADGLKLARDAEAISGRSFEFLPSCRMLSGRKASPVRDVPPFRLLYLGRWHVNKGTDLLLDALKLLCDADWARIAEIHIAGGGALRPKVEQCVLRLSAAGRPIRLNGFLNRPEAESALADADRLLLPSRIESIPVVFSDALSYDLPLVCMPVGDLPALLKDGGGWIASSVSSRGFAEAIRSSLSGPPAGHGEALTHLRSKFDVTQVAAKIAARSGAR